MPSRSPVFVTVNVTVVVTRSRRSSTIGRDLQVEYSNVVYDRPWPNSNSGSMPCSSYHL